MDVSRRFHQLYTYEYGMPLEFVARCCVLLVITILFTFETNWVLGPIWLAIYFGLHMLKFSYFCWRWKTPTRLDLWLMSATLLLLHAVFISLPGYLLLEDNLASQLGGAAALLGFVLWLIARSDLPRPLILGEVILIAAAMALLVAFAVQKIDHLGEQLAVVVCGIGVVIYFILTIYTTRNNHMKAREALLRAADAQKLEALGHLASGVAHDFNNILTAMAGNLDLYRELQNPQERENCIDEALRAANRGKCLVKKLLSYGREEEGVPQVIALHEVVDEVALLSRRLLPAPVHLSISAPRSDLELLVRGEDLTTALLNLIVNARDAMPEGGDVFVSITAQHVKTAKAMLDGAPIPPGRYARIDVTDTGPGMPRDVLNRALEPFFSTKPEGAGAGLGLPLAAEFARTAGGGLTISTSPKGTRVTIYLPADHHEALQHATAA